MAVRRAFVCIFYVDVDALCTGIVINIETTSCIRSISQDDNNKQSLA